MDAAPRLIRTCWSVVSRSSSKDWWSNSQSRAAAEALPALLADLVAQPVSRMRMKEDFLDSAEAQLVELFDRAAAHGEFAAVVPVDLILDSVAGTLLLHVGLIGAPVTADLASEREWQNSLANFPDGPVELKTLTMAFSGIRDEGGTFRAHLELARITIAHKQRVLVLQTVGHAELEGGSNSFANLVGALQDDERRVNDLESALSSVLLRLSTLELKRHTGWLHSVSTPGEVDALLAAVDRLRDFGDDLNVGASQPDVAIEIERSNDGSLIVFPAKAI